MVRLYFGSVLAGRSVGYIANAAPPSVPAMYTLDERNAGQSLPLARKIGIAINDAATTAGIIQPQGCERKLSTACGRTYRLATRLNTVSSTSAHQARAATRRDRL